MNHEPTPRGRLISSCLATAGACLCSSPWLLLAGYGLGLIPIIVLSRVYSVHLRFLLIIVLPVAVMSLFVWPVLLGAPPGELAGSNPWGAFQFAVRTVTRLAFIGGVFQAAILSLSPSQMSTTLWKWGIRGDWLIVVLAAVVLAPEMKRRVDRVITAATSRGFLKSRRLFHRTSLALTSIVPLSAWSFKSAISRAQTWHERKLLDRIGTQASENNRGSVMIDFIAISATVSWLLLVLEQRWDLQWLS